MWTSLHLSCLVLTSSSLSLMKRMTMKISISPNTSWTCTDLRTMLSIQTSRWKRCKPTLSSVEPSILNSTKKLLWFWRKSTKPSDKSKRERIRILIKLLSDNWSPLLDCQKPLLELIVKLPSPLLTSKKFADFLSNQISAFRKTISNSRKFKSYWTLSKELSEKETKNWPTLTKRKVLLPSRFQPTLRHNNQRENRRSRSHSMNIRNYPCKLWLWWRNSKWPTKRMFNNMKSSISWWASLSWNATKLQLLLRSPSRPPKRSKMSFHTW